MLCGHAPYHDFVRDAAVMGAIVEGDRPKKPESATRLGFTEALWGIVEQCWLEDRNARPGAEDVLSCLNSVPPWHTRMRVTVRKAITVYKRMFGDSQ